MALYPIQSVKIVFLLSLIICVRSFVDANSCGERLSTRMDQDVFTRHRLTSRVFESQPINAPLECHVKCMKNCRCLSYNICNGGKLCELNSEKKENNISLYKQSDTCDYYEYEFIKLVSKKGTLGFLLNLFRGVRGCWYRVYKKKETFEIKSRKTESFRIQGVSVKKNEIQINFNEF